MRKVNPQDVRSRFIKEADAISQHVTRVGGAIAGMTSSSQDMNRLSETSFLSLYVAFEGFLSDLILAYLNRDSTVFRKDLKSRLVTSAESKFGPVVSAAIRLPLGKHLSLNTLVALTDREAQNISLPSCKALKDKAAQWLAAPHRTRIASLSPEDERLIDTARAIRHFIAHRSTASKQEMAAQLASISAPSGNPHLGRGTNTVHNVGAYLKAAMAGSTRFERYVERLKEIAAKA